MRAFTDRVPGLGSFAWQLLRHTSNGDQPSTHPSLVNNPCVGHCAVAWLAHLLYQGGAESVRGYIFAHPPQVKCGSRRVYSTLSIYPEGRLLARPSLPLSKYVSFARAQDAGDGSVPGLGPGNVLVPHGSEIR